MCTTTATTTTTTTTITTAYYLLQTWVDASIRSGEPGVSNTTAWSRPISSHPAHLTPGEDQTTATICI